MAWDIDMIGLVTILVRRLVKTSVRAPGAAWSATSLNWSVTGNRKLPTTAHMPAIKVLSMYCEMTTRKRGPKPPPALAMLTATNTATRTGAIAFKALTKIVPRMLIPVHWGAVSPRKAPIMRPASMRSTRLVSLHLSIRLLNVMYKEIITVLPVL